MCDTYSFHGLYLLFKYIQQSHMGVVQSNRLLLLLLLLLLLVMVLALLSVLSIVMIVL